MLVTLTGKISILIKRLCSGHRIEASFTQDALAIHLELVIRGSDFGDPPVTLEKLFVLSQNVMTLSRAH